MNYTNLTKAFISSVVFIFFMIQLAGCGVPKDETDQAKQPFFIGKWVVNGIITKQYNSLDSTSKAIYNTQMNAMLDSSFINFMPDSSYTMQIGPTIEKGVWINGENDDKLVLKSTKKSLTRYLVLDKNKSGFRLKNIDDKDSSIIELVKE